MRTTKIRSKLSLLFIALAAMIAFPAAAALADNLQDSITAGSNAKTIATGSGGAWENKYWVEATGSGGAGCDIPSGGNAKFKLNLPASGAVTASATDLTFTACGSASSNNVPVTFSSDTPGVYNISASFVSETDANGVTTTAAAADTYNESPSNLTLTVFGVSSVTPANGATGVPVDSNATATFSENPTATPSTSTFKLVKDGDTTNTPVGASVTYNSTTKTATLNPTSDLDPGAKYNATISGLAFNGVTMEDKKWSFTTAAPADSTPPSVSSIDRKAGAQNPTNASSVEWTVTFSESVTGVDATDFSLANTGLTSPGPISVSGSGTTWTVTASTGSGDGSLGLNLTDDNSIKDAANNALAGTNSSSDGSFTGQVYTIDKTKPVITASATTLPGGAPYTAGTWTNANVAVNFSCADNSGGSGIGTDTVAGGTTLTTEGADQSVTNTGSCTDKAGNTAASATFSNIDIDQTAPTISPSATVPNGTGTSPYTVGTWTNKTVTVSYSCSDALSGYESCDTDDVFENEGANQSASGSVTDRAGNTATATFEDIDIDKTAPVIVRNTSADSCSTPGSNGWCRGTQTAGFSASDSLSDLADASKASFTQSRSQDTDSNGANIASGPVSDKAGNTNAGINAGLFYIDATKPSAPTFSGIEAKTYPVNNLPAQSAVSCSSTDPTPGSGLDGSCSFTGYSSSFGSHTLKATAKDKAGNENTGSLTYIVGVQSGEILSPVNSTGRANPLATNLDSFKIKSVVPVKFQMYLDANKTQLMTSPPAGSVAKLSFFQYDKTTDTSDAVELISAGSANTGSDFRWDGSPNNQYIYNLATSGKAAGTYGVQLTLTDSNGTQLAQSAKYYFVLRS